MCQGQGLLLCHRWDEMSLEDDWFAFLRLVVGIEGLEGSIRGCGTNDGHVGVVEVDSTRVASVIPTKYDASCEDFAIGTVGGAFMWLEGLC